MKTLISAALAASALLCSAASAATLNFLEAGDGFQRTNTITLSNATITGFGEELFIGNFLDGNGIVCSVALNVTCAADFEITFDAAVNQLSFQTLNFTPDVVVEVTAFNGFTAVGSIVVSSATLVDLSALGTITRLVFDDSSAGAGFYYGGFSFELAGDAVPLPAAAPLFAAAFGGAAFLRRRRQARA
ncbi:VPLPA-CTERM sorting domain-containing protein [Parvularcula sp. LCG005]|uniref:VPLPA-CTERM sorting domain-containing protein n=1 Tax=Parvularcula sp. LCG005 TaxID=3078805 RepID=UPI002942790E|nr:VPLPA-CTERM sorting domain-containing protein [Parvularcula sp. LCG005]WOI52421.1 VPLPA-CTERM sorting domain-containing protein [Parvularcula sp. LCG005]